MEARAIVELFVRERLAFALTFALLAPVTGRAGPATDPTAEATPEVIPTKTPVPPLPPAPPDGDGVPVVPEPPRAPRPCVAGALALLFPGLGHAYLGEPGRGVAWLGVEALEVGAIVATISTSGWDPDDASDTRYRRAMLPASLLQNTHLLGAYDAWRRARERAPEGRYRTGVPTPDAIGLLRAPIAGEQLLRPEVAIPLGLVWSAGLAVGLTAEGSEATFRELREIPVFSHEVSRPTAFAVAGGYYAATFSPVGIGEEALFRGVLQTALEERLGPTWGWLTATLFFAALHAANGATAGEAAVAVAATSVVGGYLGWLYRRDGHDLTGAAFTHTWYDVGVGLTVFLLDPEHQPFSAGLTVPF